jgi:hypothetical protein
MNWNIEENSQYQISETESLKELKSYLIQNNINCPVTIKQGDKNFWFCSNTTSSCLHACKGATGQTGPTGPTNSNNLTTEEQKYRDQFKPVLDPRLTEINITFTTLNEYLNHYKTLPFHLSKNRSDQTYTTWLNKPVIQYISLTYGKYKKPAFDDTFASIKTLNPNLTDQELMQLCFKHNFDLIEEKVYCGDKNCLKTFTKNVEHVIQNTELMTFKILLCDLPQNMKISKNMLKGVQYKF